MCTPRADVPSCTPCPLLQIEIDGQGYVVTGLVLKYKLVKGKYVREHNRLEVQPTGRYFVNMMLDNLVKATYLGPTGNQD
jgi:hypothetical protein